MYPIPEVDEFSSSSSSSSSLGRRRGIVFRPNNPNGYETDSHSSSMNTSSTTSERKDDIDIVDEVELLNELKYYQKQWADEPTRSSPSYNQPLPISYPQLIRNQGYFRKIIKTRLKWRKLTSWNGIQFRVVNKKLETNQNGLEAVERITTKAFVNKFLRLKKNFLLKKKVSKMVKK